jgi:hypothetical protein
MSSSGMPLRRRRVANVWSEIMVEKVVNAAFFKQVLNHFRQLRTVMCPTALPSQRSRSVWSTARATLFKGRYTSLYTI